MKLDGLLQILIDQRGSDLFLSVGIEPCLKVNGRINRLGNLPLDAEMVSEFIKEAMTPEQYQRYCSAHEANFALQRPIELGRFRVSCFWQMGNPGMVIRRIITEIPTMEELYLPDVLREVCLTKRGLVLFVGATGAGKSTTQAAMIGYRNQMTDGHILTIEDPVEFVHQHGRSIITQREVGADTDSFDNALKSALRQAPDVILLGEIRSQETMEFALSFAETGHLCMATLHANNANQALERIMHLVPVEKHRQLLYDLSFNLKAIVAQQLIPTRDGMSRRACFEIMLGTPLIKDIIRKGELHRLKEVMTNSREHGMVTFNQSIFNLYRLGIIGYNEALTFADSPNDVRLMIKLDGGEGYDSGMLSNVTVD